MRERDRKLLDYVSARRIQASKRALELRNDFSHHYLDAIRYVVASQQPIEFVEVKLVVEKDSLPETSGEQGQYLVSYDSEPPRWTSEDELFKKNRVAEEWARRVKESIDESCGMPPSSLAGSRASGSAISAMSSQSAWTLKPGMPKVGDRLRVLKENYNSIGEAAGAILTVIVANGNWFRTAPSDTTKYRPGARWGFEYPQCFDQNGLEPVAGEPVKAEAKPAGCAHSWATYESVISMANNFQYCRACGAREDGR